MNKDEFCCFMDDFIFQIENDIFREQLEGALARFRHSQSVEEEVRNGKD